MAGRGTRGTLGLMRGCVKLVLKKGWWREMTERGEAASHLPTPS